MSVTRIPKTFEKSVLLRYKETELLGSLRRQRETYVSVKEKNRYPSDPDEYTLITFTDVSIFF